MTSQAKTQTITINILSDISKSKDIQTMEFCQLIEYGARIIFLEKLYREWSRENRPLFAF